MRRTNTNRNYRASERVLVLLLLAGYLLLAGRAIAQTPASETGSYPNTRIVDPASVNLEPVLPVRLALAPFSFVGSKLERGLYLVEEYKLQNRLQAILGNPKLRPLFGNLGDSTGFGGGVAFSTVGVPTQRSGFVGSFLVTTKKYAEATGGVRVLQDSNIGPITLDLIAGYRLRPEENFWGSGAEPGSQRTNFNLHEQSTGALITVRHSSRLRSGTEVKYSSTSIFAGEDSKYPSTVAAFGTANLPGLMNGAELFETSLFTEYDTRDNSTAPVKGFYLLAKMSSVDGVNGSDFSYWHYGVDQRLYVPLGSDRRVLAVRTLLEFNDTRDGSSMPFFRLARLGGTETLRGYDANRFYGRNAATWNVEYRTDLTGGLGAFAFTDFGQVFDRRSEFNARNFHATYGGGLQLKSRNSIFLRTYVARSAERTRLMITFGTTF